MIIKYLINWMMFFFKKTWLCTHERIHLLQQLGNQSNIKLFRRDLNNVMNINS